MELRKCSGFFFTGGRQGRLLDVLLPGGDTTLALRAILDRYREGAVIAATGAAVIAVGRVAIEAGESPGAVAEGVTTAEGSDGLFLRPGLGVSEGRVGRLLVAVLATKSVSVGLGIDENTALVVDGDSARVIGGSGVTVLDGRRARKVAPHFGSDVRVLLAGAGDRLDLHSLAVTPAADKETTDPAAAGHSYARQVAEIAAQAGVRRLAPIHHHPKRDAAGLQEIVRDLEADGSTPVLLLQEGTTYDIA